MSPQPQAAAASAPPHGDARSTGCACAERPIVFDCEGERLLGILHPAAGDAAGDTGMVIIVGGPQYRAGSHRHFVEIARAVAEAGHPVLRFDVRGMGDCTGGLRDFEQITADVGAAIGTLLAQQPRLRRVVLWGLCDGASAALLYLHERPDPRVSGLCLLNPWVRSAQSLARTHVKHYYRQRLMQRSFWRKLLSGKVAAAALVGLWKNVRAVRAPAAARPAFQSRMASAWQAFDGPIWLLLCDKDYTAREFLELAQADPAWRGLLDRPGVSRHTAKHADHTLSEPQARLEAQASMLAWLQGASAAGSTHAGARGA